MTLFPHPEMHIRADHDVMDDDNIVMVVNGGRLDPQQLVSKVDPDSPGRAWLFRGLVGTFTGWLTVIVFSWAGDTWALFIACVTMALAIWRSDGAGVHDLLSEMSSRRPAGQSLTVRPGLEISTVRVADLRAGDSVYPADEFKKRMADYDRRFAERTAWSERVNTARHKAYERRERLRSDRGSVAPPPLPYRGLPVPSPVIRYRDVIAIKPEHNGHRVRIGLACGQIIERDLDDDMLVQRRVAPFRKRDTEPAARALDALLAELRHRPSPVSEHDLVTTLIADHHIRPAIRHALRAAVATHLISRQTGFSQFLGRVGRALARGPDNNWHGEDCELTLTHLGELWLTAITIADDRTNLPPEVPTVNITIRNFQIGDHNVIQQTASTRERELAAVKQLLAAMSANTDGLRDVTEALRTLKDAVAHGQPDTPASRSALRTVLKRSSRDVLIGIIGNASYAILLSLVGLPPQ